MSPRRRRTPFEELLAELGEMGLAPKLVGLPAPFFPTGPPTPMAPLAPRAPAAPGAPAAPPPPAAPAAPGPGGAARRSADDVDGYAGPARAPAAASGAAPPPPQGPRRGPDAMRVALKEVGAREEPPHSNGGPRVDVYTGGRREPWCAHFVSWCFEQTGKSPFGHKTYVPSLRDWARRRGSFYPAQSSTPEPGDIFTMERYDQRGKLVGGHTGYVVEAISGGKVRTVEGNAGDRVKVAERPVAALEGFIKL